jgi:hypothetical protein
MDRASETASMKAVVVCRTIGVPVQAAWEVVRTGDRVDRWIPVVTSCRLEGHGAGARRTCTIDGREVVESIATVDDAARVFQYRIERQSLMPIRDALGTLHLIGRGPAETEIVWITNFALEDERAWPAVKEGMEQIYRSAIDGLASFASSSGAPAAG